MANRHNAFKKGGGVAPKHDPDKKEYNAQGSHLMKEAKEKKHGGKVKKKAGGGEVKVVGRASGGRLDKRARGGGVGKVHASGKDMTASPFSGAHVRPQVDGGNPSVHKGK